VLVTAEFNSSITQTEAFLNSRPLMALSSDPNDPSYLSPGHFLIGAPLNSLLEPAFALQQWTADPYGKEFNTSISSYGKDGHLTT